MKLRSYLNVVNLLYLRKLVAKRISCRASAGRGKDVSERHHSSKRDR